PPHGQSRPCRAWQRRCVLAHHPRRPPRPDGERAGGRGAMSGFALTPEKASRARPRRGGWSWGPVEGVRLRALSLGAGIQSTTMALMAEHGEIDPKPDCAIYVEMEDGSATREHVEWL